MMRRLFMVLCLMAGPVRADAPLLVFAASSLAGPLDQVAEAWEGEVLVSYAGSATLARQVEAGAPADIVILANAAWMDRLLAQGAVTAASVQPILSNRLVLAARGGDAALSVRQAVQALPQDARIATGFTEAVPAGIYARQALESLGLWSDLSSLLVQVENVRLALALAARGDVAAAFVYQSDVVAEPHVIAIATVDPAHHDPIRYLAAATRGTGDQSTGDALAFLTFLTSPEVQGVFADAGFIPLP